MELSGIILLPSRIPDSILPTTRLVHRLEIILFCLFPSASTCCVHLGVCSALTGQTLNLHSISLRWWLEVKLSWEILRSVASSWFIVLKVSKSRRWLSPTTPASILANNTFWLWVLQDLVKIKIPPHWYAIVYLPSMSTVQHGKMPLDESWLCSPVSTLPSCFHSHPLCTFSWFALHNVLLQRPVPPSASQQGHLPQCCQGMDGRHGITVRYYL